MDETQVKDTEYVWFQSNDALLDFCEIPPDHRQWLKDNKIAIGGGWIGIIRVYYEEDGRMVYGNVIDLPIIKENWRKCLPVFDAEKCKKNIRDWIIWVINGGDYKADKLFSYKE